jgi:serine/threonine protein kinase
MNSRATSSSSPHRDGVTLVLDQASAMEVIAIPGESGDFRRRTESFQMSDLPSQQQPDAEQLGHDTVRCETLKTPQLLDHRPFDELGPPANPIAFPKPRFDRGIRDVVLCYIPSTDSEEKLFNVLHRDYSREGNMDELRRAYWPISHKRPIRTIMGHVEICLVLVRCPKEGDDSDDEEDPDDEIVFQMTEERVAVKVNYSHRMEKLRHKHAEDPLKEVSAMQLIGDSQEVLFDGQNLNVVMRYCDGGDLFQLLQDCQNKPDRTTPGMSEAEARYWFRQIMEGIRYLHYEVGICHRDLSPENVMIDNSQSCLVIDMGMCLRTPYMDATKPGHVTDLRNGSRRCLILPQGACGKLPYMSPEVFKNRASFDGELVDIFTAGTILFCMVSGNKSYQVSRPFDRRRIVDDDRPQDILIICLLLSRTVATSPVRSSILLDDAWTCATISRLASAAKRRGSSFVTKHAAGRSEITIDNK